MKSNINILLALIISCMPWSAISGQTSSSQSTTVPDTTVVDTIAVDSVKPTGRPGAKKWVGP